MRFCSLGSGSKGNATLVESGATLLLIDCGFTLKETEQRLRQLGRDPADISAVLVTHEHGDHIRGVGPLARKYGMPVYASHGTAKYPGLHPLDDLQLINTHRAFAVGSIDITPVAVPHDAREPCQFVFRDARACLGLLTDLGSITPHVRDSYALCDGLMLEFNHDLNMLARGPYPPSLKQRVGSAWGHLNNHQAAGFLADFDRSRLQHLVVSHISQQNNTPALARAAIGELFDDGEALVMAAQDEGFGWRELA